MQPVKLGQKQLLWKPATNNSVTSLEQIRRPIFQHLKKLKNTFALFITQKKAAMHVMISGIFFTQKITK